MTALVLLLAGFILAPGSAFADTNAAQPMVLAANDADAKDADAKDEKKDVAGKGEEKKKVEEEPDCE